MKIRNFIKISVLTSLFVFFSACSQDELSSDKSPIPEKSSLTRQVTEEQALIFSEKAVQAMFSNDDSPLNRSSVSNLKSVAKSSKSVSRKVEEIYTDDGKVALYIINLGDDAGYMIISGDKESSSTMLAFNDVGNLNYSSLDKNSTMALWLEEKRQLISEDLNSEKNPDDDNYLMWDGFSSTDSDVEIELELLSFRPSKDNDNEPTLRGRHKGSWGLAGQGVGYQVYYNTWGQGTGYNADAKNGAYIGCPAVAIGLLCRYYYFPYSYDYWSMPQKLNTSSSNAISKMFRSIADNIPNYSWGSGPGRESGATEPNIVTGLRKLGYTDAKSRDYNFDVAYKSIEKDRPVLLAGFQNQYGQGGHIWIADGYWEQTWKVTRKFAGIKVKSWYEYVDMLYMNWGWDGTGNGWIDQADWNSGRASFNYARRMFYDVYPVR